MRALIISEYFNAGGAENIAKMQRSMLEKAGVEVKMLCFAYSMTDKTPDESLENVIFFPIASWKKLIISRSVVRKLREQIDALDPDIIILHNVFSSPRSVYRAVRGYKALQIVHDVHSICPNTLGVFQDGPWRECNCVRGKQCYMHCSSYGRIKISLKRFLLSQIAREKALSKIRQVSPSEWLYRRLADNGVDANCLNNPIAVPSSLNSHLLQKNKRFLYAGGLAERKGYLDLCSAFTKIGGDHSLVIAGSARECSDLNGFFRDISADKRIEYVGELSSEEMLDLMQSCDFLIVPSKWAENYPTVVLEAFSCGLVVAGSDRGGIPEMLADGRGYVFVSGDENGLSNLLDQLANAITQESYSRVRSNAFDYALRRSDKKLYLSRLMALARGSVESDSSDEDSHNSNICK